MFTGLTEYRTQVACDYPYTSGDAASNCFLVPRIACSKHIHSRPRKRTINLLGDTMRLDNSGCVVVSFGSGLPSSGVIDEKCVRLLKMAGYYSNIYNDACYEKFRDAFNEGAYDYVINRAAVMRENVNKCHSKSLGSTCTFYGPLNTPRVLQESFLTRGLGQTLTECPECSVRYLPESVFPPQEQRVCQDTELQPLFTRLPKSCDSLTEVDISDYSALPSNYQRGYTGYNSVVDSHMQSREIARENFRAAPRTDYQSRQNYGSYDIGCGCG